MNSFQVLIETYWNVKKFYPHWFYLPGSSINRNILECKDGKTLRLRIIPVVLIETYWNVKEGTIFYIGSTSGGINRNILECKVVNSIRADVNSIRY